MTYDERREIGEYMDIVKKNCERLMRSVEMMQDKIGNMKCDSEDNKQSEKEKFLKQF